MALPKIIQKLFSDAGKGTKLNSEIIPPLKDKTSEELFTFIGEKGELTYNTTEKRIVAHDGVTKGGIPLAKKAEVDAIDVGVTSVNGNTGDITPEQTGCLPLHGGRLSGVILGEKNKLTEMVFSSGTGWGDGDASIYLRNSNSLEAGTFAITTGRQDAFVALIGFPDGRLEWNGDNVFTSHGGFMEGNIGFPTGYLVSNNVDSLREFLVGADGDGHKGAFLSLRRNDSPDNSGAFGLYTVYGDGVIGPSLFGTNSGDLYWNGGRVITGSDIFMSGDKSTTLPSGGTWAVHGLSSGSEHDSVVCQYLAGGSYVSLDNWGGGAFILAIRVW